MISRSHVRKVIYGFLGIVAVTLSISVITKGFKPVIEGEIRTNLPILVLRVTENATKPVDVNKLDDYVLAEMDVINSDDGIQIFADPYINSKVVETHRVGFKMRGESSKNFPKKQFALKIYQNFQPGEDSHIEPKSKDISLLGFPSQHKFALYASGRDPTFIRSRLSYDLSSQLGHYAPRMKFVELFIVSTNTTKIRYPQNYYGVFILEEVIKRGKDFVDIHKMEATNNTKNTSNDLTGGYIFRADKTSGNETSFRAFEHVYSMVYPDSDDVLPNMVDYLTQYMSRVEEALASPDYSYNGQHYTSMIEVDSFVDTILVQELAKNQDAYKLSTYYHKDKKGKVVSGPIWDMDRTFGLQFSFYNYDSTEGFFVALKPGPAEHLLSVPRWWTALVKEPVFAARLKARWAEAKSNDGPLSKNNMNQIVREYESQLKKTGAINREYNAWGPWYYPLKFWTTKSYFDSELAAMEKWMHTRWDWIDANINTIGQFD